MNQLNKEQEKMLRDYRKLALASLKHWQKYGFRKKYNKQAEFEALQLRCLTQGLGQNIRAMSLTD